MKVLVRGNTVMVQTEITEENYKKFSKHGVFEVKDEYGDQVYKLLHRPNAASNVAKFAIVTTGVYQGKLIATAVVDTDMEEFLESIKPELVALKENETIILEQIAAMAARLDSVNDSITIEE